jgi:hypothetical protein
MANINEATGIRYGVISIHDIVQAWSDTARPIYGDPRCPTCGRKAGRNPTDPNLSPPDYIADFEYHCDTCKAGFDSDEAYPDEPLDETIDDEEYLAQRCLDTDVMVMKSPYYTFTRLCSPCVPNAGDLNTTDAHGYKAYCFGHDFFDNQRAPYKVFRVDDDTEVPSPMPDDAVTTKISELAAQYPDHEVLAAKVWMNGMYCGILRDNDRKPIFIRTSNTDGAPDVKFDNLKDHDPGWTETFLGLILRNQLICEHPIIRKDGEE